MKSLKQKEHQKLHDYIKVFPNVLETQACEDIINNKQYTFTAASAGTGATPAEIAKYRNCYITGLFEEDDKIIYRAVEKTLNSYIATLGPYSAAMNLVGDTGYDFLKYETGGFYTTHLDDDTANPRRISISLLLNDEYEGGEFQFFGEYRVTGKTGSAIVFPSNFCYPHEVLPVTSGTRYSIITWMY